MWKSFFILIVIAWIAAPSFAADEGNAVTATATAPAVRLISDVEYAVVEGGNGKESLKLDVRMPNRPGTKPIVLIVHGGGWSGGDKAKDITPLFGPLADAGFVTFSINYRLAPVNKWPACYEDVKTAIKWVKLHGGEYQGDVKHVAILGHSAGGHLVCLAATWAAEEVGVQAVIGCAPVTDFEQDLAQRGGVSPALQAFLGLPHEVNEEALKKLRELSPINHVKAGQPPMLILQGDLDKTVPYQQSLNYEKKLKEAGVRCDLVVVKGAPHAVTSWDGIDGSYKEKMVAWLKEVLGDGVTKN